MYLLNQANQAVRSQLEQALRGLNLTGIQYTVLSIVGTRNGISSAEKRGLLQREASAENKRILTASLTGLGEETLKECDGIADGIERAAFADMSDKDFNELRRILRGRLVALRGG